MLGGNDYSCQIEASDNDLPQFGSLALGIGNALEQFVRMTIEKRAGFGQVHSPSHPAEEHYPELGLQLVDLIGYVGLADAEFLGRPGETRMSRDRLENSKARERDCSGRVWSVGLLFGHGEQPK